MTGLMLALAVLSPPPLQQVAENTAVPVVDPTPTRATAARALVQPVIDGSDADDIWRTAPVIAGFRQFDPAEDADATFRTEFRVAYDDDEFFVFVRAFDPSPDSILHALSRRDVRGPSDQIKIIIDAYLDRRTAFEFAVNPDGVKRDFAIYNDGAEDPSWNGIWDAAVRTDSLGWTAEFRIPFSQLRYAPKDTHTFGFGVWRDIERFKERDSWPAYRPSRPGLVSQLGEISGITGIGAPARLELTPYILMRNGSRLAEDGFDRAQEQSVGADLRYAVTPNVSLTATVNPDFGQVEADPATVNLTAFETFFSEQRPFFVEGTGLYRFELNCYIVQDCGNEGLFYSRRIGRAPQLAGRHGDASSPIATPILAAMKLTGRSQGGFSFGVLDAFTRHQTGPGSRTIEPATNYAVVRAKQDFRNGASDVSVIGTAVNRSLDEWSEDFLRSTAYVLGANARHRFGGGNYQISGALVASRVTGSPEAIAATQRDNVHAFQRPDGPGRYDPTRTSLSGTSQELIVGKYGGGVTRFETAFERQSAGFDPNDIGYLQRADQVRWATWTSLNFNEPRGIYNSLRFNANQWNGWTTDGLHLESAVNTNAHMTLRNNWSVHAGGTLGRLGTSYCDRCSRGGPAVRESRTLYPWFGINGDNRGLLTPNLWVNLGRTDEGRTKSISLSPSLALRFSTRLRISAGMGWSRNIDDAQWYGNVADDDGVTHYSFAHLDQRTLSLNARVAYAATPDLTFDVYAEPFTSSGTWSDVRELSDTPRASAFADRYRPYSPPDGTATGFEVRALRSNAVVRWEFRPGSTLYVVWSHARSGSQDPLSERSWRTEYDQLLDLHPDNTFLIKMSYWFNR